GDVPSAAALAGAALVLGQPAHLASLDAALPESAALLAALEALGAPVRLDGDPLIDSVPVLVAAACFAEGESRFENVANLQLKESDRIGDLCAELQRAGCDAQPFDDAIVVRGRPGGIAGGATVDAHDDHRLAQALALVALRSRAGLTITGADAVAKSYPSFFEDLRLLGAVVHEI